MRRIFRGGRLILPEGIRTGLALVVDGDRITGLSRKGRLVPGCDADIVLFDDDVNVSRVFIGGREITGQTTNHNHIHYE